jgi:hypothetical protein
LCVQVLVFLKVLVVQDGVKSVAVSLVYYRRVYLNMMSQVQHR